MFGEIERRDSRGASDECDLTAYWRWGPDVVYEDPWLEAARFAMSMDTTGGAIVSRLLARGFRRNDFPWGFSNLDAFVHFHEPIGTEWLHIETRILTGSEGYVSGQTQTWSSAGNLLATAISQLAFFTATKGT